ncbi:hypothetical protein HDU97_005754 [Phlyctochytrium planicorne]|nr:hypothetical protein HDU97_005754 [Phlyctochytrium planicorne]
MVVAKAIMKLLLPVVLLLLLAVDEACAFTAPSMSRTKRIVSANMQYFYDEFGRTRQFRYRIVCICIWDRGSDRSLTSTSLFNGSFNMHSNNNRGTSVVYKAPPYTPNIADDAAPEFSFNKKDVEILATNGVTAIRLGVMWPGVEPVRGQYDQNYLNTMKEIVRMCEDAGIYIILDMHQDSFSEKFCGEGVPLWAAQPKKGLIGFPVPLETKSYPVDSNGIPSKEDCDKHYWPEYQFTYELSSAVQRLYDNYDNLRDSFVDYWKVLAQTFKGFSNILGYEIMNEPWAGDIYSDASLLVPGIADAKVLQPFYSIVAKGIRSVDPDAIIFFESVTWDVLLNGFTDVPGGADYKSKSVLSFHHYYPSPNPQELNLTVPTRFEDMRRLGSGGMLTEFEMGWKEGANVETIRWKSKYMESVFLSYVGWEYTDYVVMTGTNNGLRDPKTGLVRPDMANVYSRTYATAIPGFPISQDFTDATGKYTITYLQGQYTPSSAAIKTPNTPSRPSKPSNSTTTQKIQKRQIYPTKPKVLALTGDLTATAAELRLAPEWHYPKGFTVSVTVGGQKEVTVTAAKSGNTNGLGSRVAVFVYDGFVYVMAKDSVAAQAISGTQVEIVVERVI